MRILRIAMLLLVACWISGCGGGGDAPGVDRLGEADPAIDRAEGLKADLMNLKKGEGKMAEKVGMLVETMEEHESWAVEKAEDKETYAAIAKLAQEAASASEADAKAKVEEMIKLADKLPGEWPAE